MNKRSERIRAITKMSLMTALMCVSALIYIPTVVPITLQTLVLYLSLLFIGGWQTAAVVALYIAIGAVGLPVFSGFSGGVGRLFDASGGFIIGMLAAALIWWLLEKILPFKIKARAVILFSASLAVLYICGTLWYAFVYLGGSDGLIPALTVCVLPFIVPDVLKICTAYVISEKLKKIF